jgi:hypothetical protein
LHDGHGPFPNLPLPRHNSHTSFVFCSGAGFTGTSLLGVGGLYRLDCMGRRLRMCVKTLSVFLKYFSRDTGWEAAGSSPAVAANFAPRQIRFC